MKLKACRILVILTLAPMLGCNRQDADALSNIGQILVQCAKAMPIVTPNAKPNSSLPTTNPADANHPDKGN